MTMLPLSPKQARFVQEYQVDGNGAQAALRAGYGPSGAKVAACRLLTRPNVMEALSIGRSAYAEKLAITRADIVSKLLEAFEMAKMKSEPMGMVRAASELARLLGLLAPAKVAVDLNVAGQPDLNHLNRLSDAELLAIIESGRAA